MRVTLSAEHTEAEVDALVAALAEAFTTTPADEGSKGNAGDLAQGSVEAAAK